MLAGSGAFVTKCHERRNGVKSLRAVAQKPNLKISENLSSMKDRRG
jgi:hypothetical protein